MNPRSKANLLRAIAEADEVGVRCAVPVNDSAIREALAAVERCEKLEQQNADLRAQIDAQDQEYCAGANHRDRLQAECERLKTALAWIITYSNDKPSAEHAARALGAMLAYWPSIADTVLGGNDAENS